MYIFSDSSIYDNGRDNPTGEYTYANIREVFEDNGSIGQRSYGYNTVNTIFTINANTLEVEYLKNRDDYDYINIPVNPVTGITCTGSITKRRDGKYNSFVYFSEEKYVFDLTFTIDSPPSDGIIATYSNDEIINCIILGRLIRGSSTRVIYIYVDSNYSTTNKRVFRTDTQLEAGDIIKINDSMTKLYGENKMD